MSSVSLGFGWSHRAQEQPQAMSQRKPSPTSGTSQAPPHCQGYSLSSCQGQGFFQTESPTVPAAWLHSAPSVALPAPAERQWRGVIPPVPSWPGL